jgi:VIT1/CCC1 family predicted Fe2+/Mn2+ transporter
MNRPHYERHSIERIGWLRAAVLGANDGVISTASLILGVAAAHAARADVLVAGVAGLAAGAMSMAAGEYVSVSSQADAERADLARERKELRDDPAFELAELAQIYVDRGVDPDLARRVAVQLTAKDALEAHARDELHISAVTAARPLQAALASAVSFSAGAVLPLIAVLLAPVSALATSVAGASLLCLVLLGALGARAGRARPWKAVWRVTLWGALALGVTAGVGRLFGAMG